MFQPSGLLYVVHRNILKCTSRSEETGASLSDTHTSHDSEGSGRALNS